MHTESQLLVVLLPALVTTASVGWLPDQAVTSTVFLLEKKRKNRKNGVKLRGSK